MLEEALRSTTYSPAEAALALLSFVQVELQAGGASAEARFFQLFPLLCDRVFGPLANADDKDKYRHQIGGWLSRDIKWEIPQASLSTTPQKSFANRVGVHANQRPVSTLSSDPVVKLLGVSRQSSSISKQQLPQTLIEAFTKEAEHRPNVRYGFPFQALPKAMQDAWLALIEASLTNVSGELNEIISENSKCLLGSLLRVKPLEQIQVRNYFQKKALKVEHRRPLQLSPGYPSPVSPTSFSFQAREVDNKDSASPSIKLSMLEYFLLIFIRYPLAAPSLPPKQTTRMTTTRGGVPIPQRVMEHYGESVYHYLFQDYVYHFIPRSRTCGHFTGFDGLSRPSELFLRIIIQLWLEGQNQLDPTNKSISVLQERRGQLIDPHSCNLNLAYDLVASRYNRPPYLVQRCIRILVTQMVLDGAILDSVRDLHSDFGSVPEVWCLSPSMTILQLPFYNYIRSSFRNASIHAKQSPFFEALTSWLIWLEPWNAIAANTKTTASKAMLDTVSRASHNKDVFLEMKTPHFTQPSRYRPFWEPYIAANLHLYTVPLALFLRRSRELDFSPREFHRSLTVVQKVLRVYSPEVVEVINRLLSSRTSEARSPLVSKHEHNLGVHAPVQDCALSLTSCRDDMHNLLEEIYIQHMKKVGEMDFLDQICAKLEGIFGKGAINGEEKALRVLVNRAKIIVGFPADYEVAPNQGRGGNFSNKASERDDDVQDDVRLGELLSQSGRQRMLQGTLKCNPLAVAHFGDVMIRRPHSHEIAFLVPLLNRLSNHLNVRMGLVRSSQIGTDGEKIDPWDTAARDEDYRKSIRINLRFLADYRNLIFIGLISWIWLRLS